MRILTIVCIVFIGISFADGHTYTDNENLITHLFNGSRYNARIRPVTDQTHATQVNSEYKKHVLQYLSKHFLVRKDIALLI